MGVIRSKMFIKASLGRVNNEKPIRLKNTGLVMKILLRQLLALAFIFKFSSA